MTAYTRISKEIGFPGKAFVPSVERSQELISEARDGNEQSFKLIFKIIRFAPSPMTPRGQDALNLLYDAFHGELAKQYQERE